MRTTAILLVKGDHVQADLDRWGISNVWHVRSSRYLEKDVETHAKVGHVIIFASPARRWALVTDALRTACIHAAGDVTLRFYQPAVTIDVRSLISTAGQKRGLCPLVEEFEQGRGADAYRLRRAVKDAIADLLASELAALAKEIREIRATVYPNEARA